VLQRMLVVHAAEGEGGGGGRCVYIMYNMQGWGVLVAGMQATSKGNRLGAPLQANQGAHIVPALVKVVPW
jgi:hypothetical protein